MVCEPLTDFQKTDLKKKFSQSNQLNQTEQRVYAIAWNISQHFKATWQGSKFKGQLVAVDLNIPAIELKNLRHQWPGQAFSLQIPALTLVVGQHLFIRGASGSGKTTLLNLLCGVLSIQQGEIRLGGQLLQPNSAARRDQLRARQIGRARPVELRRQTGIAGAAPIGFPAGGQLQVQRSHAGAAFGGPAGQDICRQNLRRAFRLSGQGEGEQEGKGFSHAPDMARPNDSAKSHSGDTALQWPSCRSPPAGPH